LEYDTVRFPHDKNSYYNHLIDETVTDSAAYYIQNIAPDLTWLYLEYTDDLGHEYGDSKQFYDAIEMMDKQVGKIWNAIQFRQQHFNEDWEIFITTDHGRDSITGKNHGGQTTRERITWIVTNAQNLNDHFKQMPGIIDIAPTIASFMNINIPREQQMEIDGISLTGKLSATNLHAVVENNQLHIQWIPVDTTGEIKLWLTTTNDFKKGGKDDYQLIATVPANTGNYFVDINKLPVSSFYKIVLEAPHNYLNTWVNIPVKNTAFASLNEIEEISAIKIVQ
jgi:hypothetical protein